MREICFVEFGSNIKGFHYESLYQTDSVWMQRRTVLLITNERTNMSTHVAGFVWQFGGRAAV